MQPLTVLRYVLNNFGPLVAFYLVNHFYGLKPAIVCAIAVALIEVALLIINKRKPTSFFKFSVGMALVFGSIDLLLTNPVFFKFEPTLTNLVTAVFFAASLWTEKTFIQEFIEKRSPEKTMTAERIQRCRWLTLIWAVYFVAKAGAYFWVSNNYSIEDALVMRSTYGTASFYALLGWSIFLSGPFFARLRQFAS